jgi:hypothetical protein
MIEFLIACSPAIPVPGMFSSPVTNCGPGDIELVEKSKKSRVKIPTRSVTILDLKIDL